MYNSYCRRPCSKELLCSCAASLLVVRGNSPDTMRAVVFARNPCGNEQNDSCDVVNPMGHIIVLPGHFFV